MDSTDTVRMNCAHDA